MGCPQTIFFVKSPTCSSPMREAVVIIRQQFPNSDTETIFVTRNEGSFLGNSPSSVCGQADRRACL